MQLQKLQLSGFKTFADRTEIEIHSGLTAIVGPNGSGKSNIVDALLWVLGEQNPRLLRGSTAQDVIFAGTSRRKPVGMAEARLTLDNSDRALPIDYAEVTITRRAYRSGESQYLINGTACRLKDIVELFLDTGAGKGAYAFVSQNEIDAVLSARPEDRRELFEEAAGIKKFRVKKREALRKLETAEANLTRIRDISHEIEAQIEPLERQAVRARRFIMLQERLHDIEASLLISELRRASSEAEAARQALEAADTELESAVGALAAAEAAAAGAAEAQQEAETRMDLSAAEYQAARTDLERTESRLALAEARGSSAAQSQEQLAAELAEMQERADRLCETLSEDGSEVAAATLRHNTHLALWAAAREELREAELAALAARREFEERQNKRLRMAQERAGRESSLHSLDARIAEAEENIGRIEAERDALIVTLQEARRRVTGITGEVAAFQAQQQGASARRAQAEAARQDAQRLLAQARADLDALRRAQAAQSSRLSTLVELQVSHEGFYQGVRAVLEACRRGKLHGRYEAVVDLLTVPEAYRVAIEVALGGSLQDIVTPTEQEAKAAIDWLKAERAGRATFLPIPLLRSGPPVRLPHPLSGGLLGTGCDIVTVAPEHQPMANLLLGRVVIVEDMDSALRESRRLTGWGKMVTLAGELLSPGGALTGGSLQGRGTHLMGRKGEIDDLKAAIPRAAAEVDRLDLHLGELNARLIKAEDDAALCAKQEAEARAGAAAHESARLAEERACERVGRDIADRDALLVSRRGQQDRLKEERGRVAALLAEDQAENDTADDLLLSLQRQSTDAAAARDTCRTRVVGLEVEATRLKERLESLTRSVSADGRSLEALKLQIAQKTAQRTARQADASEADEERELLTSRRMAAAAQAASAGEALELARSQRQAAQAQAAGSADALRSAALRHAAGTSARHSSEVAVARLDAQFAQAAQRLEDEYSITAVDALLRPVETPIDRNTAAEVNRLRKEVRAMGAVNTGAIEEYDRVTERAQFLAAQRGDLETGRASLLKTIEEIDSSTRGVFMETFEAVQREFDKLFTRLFDGGTTRLSLTDPSNLTETGVEIMAQPPGKKPQSLALLSGGERALTAAALLFAFLTVRPSPFVLLDEVDAPLDGANVEKFVTLVKEFSERSQILMITHNPATMEAAPLWYGVTMQEPGISSVLSFRVPEAAEMSADQAVVLLR